jgi:hypothetical protein
MRKLTEQEIEDICSIIELEKTVPFDVAISLHEHLTNELKKQLEELQKAQTMDQTNGMNMKTIQS